MWTHIPCIKVFLKKKSLFSQIKNNGSQLSKVDKSETCDADSIIHLGVISPSGNREATYEERIKAAKDINKDCIQARQSLKETCGIQSSKHADSGQWLENIQDCELVCELSRFRQDFAHRLDSLDNISKELEFPSYEDLDRRLEVVSKVLENYKRALQNILVYTTSSFDEGFVGINYDSISRIQQYVELKPLIEQGENSLTSP